MPLDPVRNFAIVEVSTGYDSSATSIVLTGGEGAKLPAPASDGAFNLVWWDGTTYPNPSDDPNVEIVRVTARSTDTLTVTRAQESTSATNKNTGGSTYQMMLSPTQKTITDIQSEIDGARLSRLTATGTVDDSNTTFSFSEEPLLLNINGGLYPASTGIYNWSWSDPNVTLAVAVGAGGFIEGLV